MVELKLKMVQQEYRIHRTIKNDLNPIPGGGGAL